MKKFLLLALLFFTCSVFAKEQVDIDCQKMALNAKSFSQLKITGVAKTKEQFEAFIVSPTVQTYPIRSILNFVFVSPEKTPEEIYSALYGKCTMMGYNNLFEYFTEREQFDALKGQLNDANNRVVQSEVIKGQLLIQIQQLKDQLKYEQLRKIPSRNAH